MRVLVLGATGMAGHTIALHLKEKGHNVTSFSRREFPYCKSIKGDIRDTELVKRIINNDKYDIIINSVGILNQYAEYNKAEAVLINSYLPHYLSSLMKETDTRIIHLSTDCVFSGKTGGYTEKSFRDGETFYDRTKALGELENTKDLSFRNSIIGPDYNINGIGLFNWFMKQNGTINGYTGAIWTGVTTLTLAKAIDTAIEQKLTGIYNLVNNEVISKFDLLQLFNKHFRNNSIVINRDDSVKLDKSLINTRNDFDFKIPGYESMVIEMKIWIEKYKYLYPHYNM